MKSENILGIDYGSQHVGLAISIGGAIPLGFKTVDGEEYSELIDQIVEIAAVNKIDTIVVGVPETVTHGDAQIVAITGFIEALQKKLPLVRVDQFNEAMTSKMARRSVAKEKEHQEAARIILEDWMSREQRGKGS